MSVDRGSWVVGREFDGQQPVSVSSYRDLRVWTLSMDWAEQVYRTTAAWPRDERFGLTAQVRRAAVSVPSNTAEGARRTTGEFLQFLGIARGSLSEAETQLTLARRLGFTNADEIEDLLSAAEAIGRMIVGLRSSLQRRR